MEPNSRHEEHPPSEASNAPDNATGPGLSSAVTIPLILIPILILTPIKQSHPQPLKNEHRRRQHKHKHMPTHIMPAAPAPAGSFARMPTEQILQNNASPALPFTVHMARRALAAPARQHEAAVEEPRAEEPLRC